jgi:hypothetical protein
MKRVSSITIGVVALAAGVASASERHFTYTYESAVLHPGGREIEPWTTFGLGREGYFVRLESRIEAELGVSDRLQTSLYLNLSAETAETGSGRVSTSRLDGVSSEWKLKLLDPVADRAGLALYGELSAGPAGVELEGKLIADKRVGRWLGALNVTAEHEWETGEPGTPREKTLELTAASAWFLARSLTLGFELRSHTVFPLAGEATRSALFAGPTVSYAREGWWLALSVLPQLRALKGASDGRLDLEEHVRVETRLVFGLEF